MVERHFNFSPQWINTIFPRAGLKIPHVKPGWLRILNGKRKLDFKYGLKNIQRILERYGMLKWKMCRNPADLHILSAAYPVLFRITWQTSYCHKFGIRVDQKLNGICVLKEKQLLAGDNIIKTLWRRPLIHTTITIYLCFYFETLGLLFVVNSGVVCCVVKMNSFSIAA